MSTVTVTGIDKFNKDLEKFLKDEKKHTRSIVVKLSLDGYRQLQRITPKKTRRAASGWHPNIDVPPSDLMPPKGASYYSLPPFDGVEQIKFNSVVNLTNNVEYIKPLDKGHSRQAANGIVNPVIAMLQAQLNSLVAAFNRRRVK